MRSLIRRAAVLAGAVAVALSTGAGAATAQSGPPQLSFNRVIQNYGAVVVGRTSAEETFTLANTGESATGPLTVSLAGPGSAQFRIVPNPGPTPGSCEGAMLQPGQQCEVTAVFAPTAAGLSRALLTAVSSQPAARAGVVLAGTGIPNRLAFNPSGPFTFGRVDPGGHETGRFDLENFLASATGPLTITLAGSPAFKIVPNPPGTTPGPCQGISLEPDASCAVWVEFSPATEGQFTATLSAAGTQPGATATVDMSGTGRVRSCSSTAAAPATGTASASASAATTRLYWADDLGDQVCTANLDGSNPQILISSADRPRGVAANGSHVYWAATQAIMQANLDGSGELALIPVAAGQEMVAVDSSHIYWAAGPGAPPPGHLPSGTVNRAPLTGGTPTELASQLDQPLGVAVAGGHIYWTDAFAGTITQANLDGTGAQTLLTGQLDPEGLAVQDGHLYWADSSEGTIMQADLNECTPQCPDTAVTELVGGQDNPIGVAVDSTHIYWTDALEADGKIMSANLDGSNVTTLVTGQEFPFGIAVGPKPAPTPPAPPTPPSPKPVPPAPPVPVTG